jgi:hypothetical protein
VVKQVIYFGTEGGVASIYRTNMKMQHFNMLLLVIFNLL